MMKNIYIIIIFITTLVSCDMPKKYSDTEIENSLFQKYNKKFTVTENNFNPQLNKYQFLAETSDKSVKFQGSYVKVGDEISDNYQQMDHSYQAEEVMKNLLDEHYEHYAVKANAAIDEYTAPEFLEVLKDEKRDIIIYYYVYLFDVSDISNTENFEGIASAANYFNTNFNGTYTFTIYFWDPEFIEDKEISDLEFGFNYNRDSYSDNPDAKSKYIKNKLVFEFDASEKPDITAARIADLVTTYPDKKTYHQLK